MPVEVSKAQDIAGPDAPDDDGDGPLDTPAVAVIKKAHRSDGHVIG